MKQKSKKTETQKEHLEKILNQPRIKSLSKKEAKGGDNDESPLSKPLISREYKKL
jgi:hypothetical protein